MAPPRPRRIVITGGPGAGKTTLIDHLRRRGHTVVDESGRAILRRRAHPAAGPIDPGDLAHAMLRRDLHHHTATRHHPGDVYFDRAIPDVVGYLDLHHRPIPADLHDAARHTRYHPQVFIAPPWPEIYRTDTLRTQTIDEAERTYHAMTDAYTRYGYELIALPRTAVAARIDFLLTALA